MGNDRFINAMQLFDMANSKDPNKEIWEGKTYPKELLYAIRMTEKLDSFEPDASEVLRLTARCQHICRWQIPRDTFEMNRVGYLKWRNALKEFHAEKAGTILKEVGYQDEIINELTFILLKKQLKKNDDTQIIEDVICLVFLEYYFEKFSTKYSEEKLIDILQKTWKKMSDKGHNAALELNFSQHSKDLISKALS